MPSAVIRGRAVGELMELMKTSLKSSGKTAVADFTPHEFAVALALLMLVTCEDLKVEPAKIVKVALDFRDGSERPVLIVPPGAMSPKSRLN